MSSECAVKSRNSCVFVVTNKIIQDSGHKAECRAVESGIYARKFSCNMCRYLYIFLICILRIMTSREPNNLRNLICVIVKQEEYGMNILLVSSARATNV